MTTYFISLLILFSLLMITGCQNEKAHPSYGHVERVPIAGVAQKRIRLAQNWHEETRQSFWYTSQGSRLIPYMWFTWLEQTDSTKLFRHSDHIQALGYLAEESSALNPGALPIGFALDIDKKTGDAWVGPTCAACHTGQIDIGDKHLLIEGGPTLGNFQQLLLKVTEALAATFNDTEKFMRFAKRILGEDYSPKNEALMRQDYDEIKSFLESYQIVNRQEDASSDNYGHGRIDAFGIIQNAGSALALNDLSNSNLANAPVSYPFLWGAHQSDVVQWNGLLPNTGLFDPLARNIGETIGALGGLTFTKAPWYERWFLGKYVRYKGHVKIANVGELEAKLRELRSPKWPEQYLPPIDDDMAARGAFHYQKHCIGCHEIITPDQEHKPYKANLIAIDTVGTDPLMATNALEHFARTGPLEGSKIAIFTGEKFASETASINFSINGTFGLMLNEPLIAYRAAKNAAQKTTSNKTNIKQAKKDLKQAMKKYQYLQATIKNDKKPCHKEDIMARYCYKARPLTGIWASAPYLHNGSVPNLLALLQAPEDRPKTFWVGSKQFDAQNVGYDSSEGLWQFNTHDPKTQKPILGNSNLGHNFSAQLSNEARLELLEFLKTL